MVQNGTTTMVNRVIRGPGIDETVAVHPVTAQPTCTLLDPQNSTIALTGPTGAIQNRLAYDEYGIPQSTNTGRFQYTGQLWLPDAQVYHDKARAWHPVLGRFLQPDPIGYGDGLNLYAYVGEDPVNRVDPTGMITCRTTWYLVTITVDGVAGQGWKDITRCTSDFPVGGSLPRDPGGGGSGGGGGAGGPVPRQRECTLNDSIPAVGQQFGGFGQGLGNAVSFGTYGDVWASVPSGGLGDMYEAQQDTVGYHFGMAV